MGGQSQSAAPCVLFPHARRASVFSTVCFIPNLAASAKLATCRFQRSNFRSVCCRELALAHAQTLARAETMVGGLCADLTTVHYLCLGCGDSESCPGGTQTCAIEQAGLLMIVVVGALLVLLLCCCLCSLNVRLIALNAGTAEEVQPPPSPPQPPSPPHPPLAPSSTMKPHGSWTLKWPWNEPGLLLCADWRTRLCPQRAAVIRVAMRRSHCGARL